MPKIQLFEEAAEARVVVRHRGKVYEGLATSLTIRETAEGPIELTIEACVTQIHDDPPAPGASAEELRESVREADEALGKDD